MYNSVSEIKMVKKILIIILPVLFVFLGTFTVAQATPIFYEEFNQDIFLDAGDEVIYKFNLTGINSSCTLCPSTDETEYNPDLWTPTDALLSFDLFSFDKANEKIKIEVKLKGDGWVKLFRETLSFDEDDGIVSFGFNLSDYDLFDEIRDGKLVASVSAPDLLIFNNDFNVGKASLQVSATPIPEPPTLTLYFVGIGIIGILITVKKLSVRIVEKS